MLSLIFLLLQLSFAIFFFFLTIAFVTGAPFVPSTNPTAQKMIELANIKKGMKVYDLGSGEGKLLFLAAQKGGQAIGLEINPFLVVFTKIKVLLSPYRGKIAVHWKDFWKADLHNADVVFIYLLPWRMEKLQKYLTKQLKPGALIVSNSFVFPNWKTLRSDESTHVYVFQIS